MKAIWKHIVSASLVLMLAASVAGSSQVVLERQSDHPHRNPNAKNAGEYHVVNLMNQRTGEIGIRILDRFEEPAYLDRESIRAELTNADGTIETAWLLAEGYEYNDEQLGTTIFSRRFDWIKDEHRATLRVWIPLPDGKTYELTFTCEADEAAPTHCGL